MTWLGLPHAFRARITFAAAAVASLALAGCQTDGPYSAKHLRPLSAKMLSLMERKGMDKHSPLLVRVFKEEAELEVWKRDATGKFALLKTYPICRWSGQLGPKMREGDRQAPEGFYAITPSAMNPNSSFYLSFNLGYPNAFDRAHGRTGAHLMVHGDCSSRGCYSMTDEQIAEIFALGREAFFGGQRSFQVQAYPFRMTALNMARHRNNPHMAFWRNLKEGYDHFEVTREEPKVAVCEKRYVFNAEGEGSFQASGKCPSYKVPEEIASAVAAKAQRDQVAFADYVRRGTRMAPVNTGRDGGMHPIFQAMYETQEVRNSRGQVTGVMVSRRTTSYGPIDYNPDPATSSLPVPSAPAASTPVATASVGTPADVPMPRPVPGRSRGGGTATAYAPSNGGSGGGFFSGIYTSSVSTVDRARSSVGKLFGFGGETAPPPAKESPRPTRQRAAPRPEEARPPIPPVREAEVQPSASPPPAPAPAPASTASATPASTPTPAPARPAAAASLVSGAQPVVPAGSFDNRWGAVGR